MGLLGLDSSADLNIKKLGKSPNFPSGTYSATCDKWFRSYIILMIDIAAEFYFWTEQRLNGIELLDLGLTETPEVLNSITVGNSLFVPMVHNMATNSQ
jgi:hypothetical protein